MSENRYGDRIFDTYVIRPGCKFDSAIFFARPIGSPLYERGPFKDETHTNMFMAGCLGRPNEFTASMLSVDIFLQGDPDPVRDVIEMLPGPLIEKISQAIRFEFYFGYPDPDQVFYPTSMDRVGEHTFKQALRSRNGSGPVHIPSAEYFSVIMKADRAMPGSKRDVTVTVSLCE